jgi:6-phosphogluconolactonase
VGAPVVRRLSPEIRIYSTPGSETAALARHIAICARRAVQARGKFSLVLSGGHTPERLYRLLARKYQSSIPWRATVVYFGDERCVPPRHPDSNYGMARDALLSRVPIPAGHVHRFHGEVRPPSTAAARYARLIDPLPRARDPDLARFDLVLLGIGPDGHTASLFPNSPALRERRRSVVAVLRAGQPPYVPRLTLTLPALCSAREICFLVAGKDKAAPVAAALRQPRRGQRPVPAGLVRAVGSTIWFLDRAASRSLSTSLQASS